MLESGWLMRARSCCCGTVSSLTDVWDREPAYGSKSAEQHRAAARRSCFEGSHYRQNSLTAALPRCCTQPAEPVMPRECLFDGEGWCTMCIIRRTGAAAKKGSGRQMMRGQVNLAQINHETTTHPIFPNYGQLFLHTSIC